MAEKEVKHEIKVQFKEETLDKINWITENINTEISAWLTGRKEGDTIIIDEMLIPEQIVSGTSVEVSAEANTNLRKQYKEKCKNIIGQWHSHTDMSAFWSYTDEEDIATMMDKRDLFVFFVSSRKDGVLARVEIREPFKISIDHVRVTREPKEQESMIKKLRKELNKKVKKEETEIITQTGKHETHSESTRAIMTYDRRTKELVITNLTEIEYMDIIEMVKTVPTQIILNQGMYIMKYKAKNGEEAKKLRQELYEVLYYASTYNQRYLQQGIGGETYEKERESYYEGVCR